MVALCQRSILNPMWALRIAIIFHLDFIFNQPRETNMLKYNSFNKDINFVVFVFIIHYKIDIYIGIIALDTNENEVRAFFLYKIQHNPKNVENPE